jgi:hypothetical protein
MRSRQRTFQSVDRLVPNTMLMNCGTREHPAAKAAFLCPRIEDNPSAGATRVRSVASALSVTDCPESEQRTFVFIRVYSWLTFADGCG